MKKMKRVLSLILCVAMIVGILPIATFAAESDDSLTTALTEAKTFIDDLTINNESNDPSTVVSQWGTQFSWDNEKRESNDKSYLFEWSYYNGVVFEGLDYIYDVTQDTAYSDYVTEYLSTMITSNGGWATCSNKSSKECAGYNSGHGADCYKTASLLLDYAKITGDSRYSVMAKTLYNDLQNAQNSYTSENRGYNYNHTWSSTPTYAVWLDGLYMIQPFMAEYAASINDTAELDRIAARFAWIGDNMYNQSTGLYYHAANSSSNYFNNNGNYWGRAIGWYAAAMVDVMDYMEGDNLATMQVQLKKLVDGMLPYQTDDGMWRQYVNNSSSTKETSATALMAYTIMKGVNNGWLDSSYAVYATNAFEGICNYALDDSGLHYISFKGSTSGYSDPTYSSYVNEGKGVGPFIMAYAEVLKYSNNQTTEPEQPEDSEPTTDNEVVVGETTIVVEGVTDLIGGEATAEDKALIESKAYENFVVYDITATIVDGATATVSIPVPAEWDTDRLIGISVEDGVVKEIEGTYADGMYTFEVDHFSAKGVALAAETGTTSGTVSGTGNLVGGSTYTLATNGVTANKKYLIVNSSSNGTRYALTNNNGSVGRTEVTVSNKKITVEDDSNIAWIFSGSTSGSVENNDVYIYPERNQIVLDDGEQNLTISNQGSGAYGIYRSDYNYYYYYDYVRYNDDSWTGGRTWQTNGIGSVYLYELTGSSSGEAVVFSITPGSETIAPKGTADLKGTVTVAGETVDLNDCTITWMSDKTNIASVSNGTVTGVEDGTANITATLSAVNGTALQKNIVLTIPVTVESKEVESAELSDSTGNVTRGSGDSALTGDTIIITYEDKTVKEVAITLSMVSGDYDSSTEGIYKNLTVTYGSYSFDYTLNVNPKEGNNYPEYPEPGAVDVNKVIGDYSQFQSIGVAEIQLSTSGIPVQTGVDVVLTIDISNSMAWATGTTSSDGFADYNKLDEVMAAVKNFANIFLADNEDGTQTNNTITIVTFAGYDAEHWNGSGTYIDSVRTLVTATSSIDVVEAIADGTRFTNADTMHIAYIPEGEDPNEVDNVTSENGTNRGDTNYDYGFWQTAQAIEDGGLGGENREIHVLFMTDGCASNFNDYYYRSSNVGYYYRPGTTTAYTYYAAANGTAWTNYILNTLIPDNNGNKYANDVYNMVNGMYAIGFDMEHGSFSGITTWDPGVDWEEKFNEIVSKVVIDANGNGLIDVTAASDTDTLNAFYESLARELRYAATDAYFVDQMGDSFDIQLGSYITKFDDNENEYTVALNPAPVITVSTYKIYTASDVGTTINGVKVTTDMIGERYGNPTIAETVVFNADGTEAYSSIDGYVTSTVLVGTDSDGKNVNATTHSGTNILVGGVICAKNFWYNTTAETKTIALADGSTYELPAETFYWNIGTINETEFVLSYYVYLEGAAKGTASADTYYTNNYAILNYTNWLGNKAEQSVQSPTLAWSSANVSYGFYLVNEEGVPVTNQTTGATGSFYDAVKVTQAVLYDTIELNSEDTVTINLVADEVLPDGYTPYDTSAAYTITVDSANTASGWKIVVGESLGATTYVTGYSGTLASNVTSESNSSYDYTATTVWFAVVWTPQCIPDTVVIDYGLPVDISVLDNDMFGTYGTLKGVGKESPLTDGAKYQTEGAKFGTNVTCTYGTAAVNGSEVRYTPSNMEMNGYDQFYYEVKYTVGGSEEDLQYYYGDVTVIPATTIYYEDEFVELKTFVKEGDAYTGKDGWDTTSVDATATQDEDRPGYYNLSLIDANNIYGYDSAYTDMSTHSMNNAAKVTVNANTYATASFTFYGTGFDVISVTSKDTGVLTVQVKDGNGQLVVSKMVDTYYGYTKDGEDWVVTDRDALYQIPVIKVSDLEYGQYTVTLRASYYDALNNIRVEGADGTETGDGSYELYLDAIRIYNPAGTEFGTDDASDGVTGNLINTTIQEAYKADNEGWPRYEEVRNNVIDAAAVTESGATEINGIAFIDGVGETANVADYISYGPNNELYLKPGQAIAFNLTLPENIDKVHLAVKSADGVDVSYKIFDANVVTEKDDLDAITAKSVTTTSDLYYDITTLKDKTIVVYNSGTSGILSLTNIKMTFTSDPGEVGSVFYIAVNTINFITANMNEEPTFKPKSVAVKTSPSKIYAGNKITVTVTTSTDVEAISVNDKLVEKYYTRGGKRVWTTTIDAVNEGTEAVTQAISIVVYNGEGIASEPTITEVTVQADRWSNSSIGKIINTLFGWLFK